MNLDCYVISFVQTSFCNFRAKLTIFSRLRKVFAENFQAIWVLCGRWRKKDGIKAQYFARNAVLIGMKMTSLRLLLLAAPLAVLSLAACSDDDSFSASPDHRLAFSADTVSLDTTFSRVPTTTRTFWVYNRSGDGVRCTSVRLRKGNQTGFRVNVDGMYLGQASGYQVGGVELRKDDSLRVFVELTSADTHSEVPELLEDDLVFTLESGVEQKVNLRAWSWDATLLDGLKISRDTLIQSTKPIVIKGNIEVDSAATLTIGAGTTLYFSNHAGIDVYGTLRAEGTPEANITLRGDRIDRMFDYLPYDRVSGQWQGIRLHASSFDNEIQYTDLHSAYNGIVCDSSAADRTKLRLYNSTVHNCQGYGLYAVGCQLDLYNTQVTNASIDCVSITGGSVVMRHCTLAQFFPFDLGKPVGVALRFGDRYEGDVTIPLTRFDIFNTIVTGYSDDEIMGNFSDVETATYLFDHCLLRTGEPETIDEAHYKGVIWENVKDTTAFGRKNFVKIDYDKQYFDFHLDSVSHAIDSAAVSPEGWGRTDRDGLPRDERPDIGCFEYRKPAEQ